MGLFTKRIGTVFLKETSDAGEYIEKLELLKEQASDELKKNSDWSKVGRKISSHTIFLMMRK